MTLIILLALVVIAFAAMRGTRNAALPDAEKAARFERRQRGKAEARGAVLFIGVPILIIAALLAHWFG
jgi:Tfp pilus assembly protein PilX